MAVTETRLLLLGAVLLFEPVNGYQVRRELLSTASTIRRVEVTRPDRPGRPDGMHRPSRGLGGGSDGASDRLR